MANDETKKCRECGQEFVLTDKESQWFQQRNLQLPVRCKSCRNKRKYKKQMEEE